jgi:hypothetical protein
MPDEELGRSLVGMQAVSGAPGSRAGKERWLQSDYHMRFKSAMSAFSPPVG